MFGIIYVSLPWLFVFVLGLMDVFTRVKLGKNLRFALGMLCLLMTVILCLAVPAADRSASFWWGLASLIAFLFYYFGRATFGPDE